MFPARFECTEFYVPFEVHVVTTQPARRSFISRSFVDIELIGWVSFFRLHLYQLIVSIETFKSNANFMFVHSILTSNRKAVSRFRFFQDGVKSPRMVETMERENIQSFHLYNNVCIKTVSFIFRIQLTFAYAYLDHNRIELFILTTGKNWNNQKCQRIQSAILGLFARFFHFLSISNRHLTVTHHCISLIILTWASLME